MRFLVFTLAMPAILISCDTAWGQFDTYDQLKRNVDNAVANGQVPLERPEFDWSGETMIYSLPRLDLWCVDEESNYLARVIAEQSLVASIHKYRCPQSNKARQFWHGVLPRVESQIRKMFELASRPPEVETTDAIIEIHKTIDRIYQDELNNLAIREGKKGATDKDGGNNMHPCKVVEVTIRIPQGASLKYMANAYYLLWIIRNSHQPNVAVNVPSNYPRWTDAANNDRIILGGKTRFMFSYQGRRLDKTLADPPGSCVLRATLGGFAWQKN